MRTRGSLAFDMPVIYLHGFNSSPKSSKATLLSSHCRERGIACKVPQLPNMPAEAMSLLEGMMDGTRPHLLVGSSMGGYYATWLCERHGNAHAVLINPAVRLAALLEDEVGRLQRNHYSGEEYEFTERHLKGFADLEVTSLRDISKYTLMVQKGDKVIDHADAVRFYAGCRQIVEEGGDHGFVGFERHLAVITDLAVSLDAA